MRHAHLGDEEACDDGIRPACNQCGAARAKATWQGHCRERQDA